MPPIVAAALALSFTLVVAAYDRMKNPRASLATWVPSLWLLILGSRPVTQWLNLGTPVTEDVSTALIDGSPLDRAVYATLMVLGLMILIRRRVSWVDFARRNPWIVIYFLYCGISVTWSDFSGIAFRRWVKGLGDPIIALVLLTDPQPAKAVELVLKRCAYLLLPLSIVFIKYYGDIGRAFDQWTGYMMFTGVTTNKNSLGYLLYMCGLFSCCMIFGKFGRNRDDERIGTLIRIMILGMIAWLFSMADSKTPLMCLTLGTAVFVGAGFAGVRKYWGTSVLVALIVFGVLQVTIDVSGLVIRSMGRDVTLTGRTELWPTLISLSGSPWLGSGYASFWLGDRLHRLWALWAFKPTQAHNGYLEIYLNLGWVGVVCLSGVIVAGFRHIQRRWSSSVSAGEPDALERDFARFGMAFLTGYLIYNITEAAFHLLHVLFVVFLIVVIEPPTRRVAVRSMEKVTKGPTPRVPQRVSVGWHSAARGKSR